MCLRDVVLFADIPAARVSGQAKAAICRDAPSIIGTVDVELACPAGTTCPNPPEGLVAKATGTVGPVVVTPEGTPPLTLQGAFTANTGSAEVRVTGRLSGNGLTLDGDMTLSAQGLHIATTIDLPPLFGVDLGPASCELDLAVPGFRLCGTCRTANPACAVDVCYDYVNGDLDASPPTCSDVTLDKLPDGAPCLADAMCQSGHCGLSASLTTPFCYTPGGGGEDVGCDPGLPDQCLADLVCALPPCSNPLLGCLPATCQPHVDLGIECVADAQCDPGQICKRPKWYLPRICLWPDRSRNVGESCYGPDECRSAACVFGGCVCAADYDCEGGERCVGGVCERPPEPPRLPGQACTSDSQCLISYANPNAGACVNGTCGCTSTPDCQSTSQYCAAPVTNLPYSGSLPLGVCIHKWSDGALCTSGEMCNHDHCGGFLRPPVCYSPDTKGYDQECVAHDECRSDKCQLDCQWGAACSPLAQTLAGPSPECVCTTTCGCSGDADCALGSFCGALTWSFQAVPGIAICIPKGAPGVGCANDNECQSGDCFDVCVNGSCQGACR